MALIGWGNFVTHLLSMLLAVINYFVFEEKGTFTFQHIWGAIIPTFLYWIVFMSIAPLLGNWYPYFFMTPWQIGWFMVFFWFFVILIFVIGLTVALVFFDQYQKKRSLLSLGIAGLICVGLVFAFGDTAPPTLVALSYQVEDVFVLEDGDHVAFLTAREVEEGISLEFEFFTTEARMHLLDLSIQAPDMIVAFLLADPETGEVLIRSISSELGIEVRGGLALSEGTFAVSWVFFQSYEDIQHFFARMDFGDIPPDQSAYFREVFAREAVDPSAYISFLLR